MVLVLFYIKGLFLKVCINFQRNEILVGKVFKYKR